LKEKKQFIPIGSEVYTSSGSKGRVVRVKKNIIGQVNFYVKNNAGNVEKFGRSKVSKSKIKGVDYV
jgi:preprotein translocase subunit YajC